MRSARSLAILAILILPVHAAGQGTAAAPECRATGTLARLPGLFEASGLAASRRLPGVLWTHNDSGKPIIYALDRAGAITGQLRLQGAKVGDWEAIAVGPCPGGSCIYVADIGDNDAKRRQVTIYRVPEPASAGNGQAQVSGVFHAVYPDGAHDAETLLVGADGTLFVVTKGDTGPVAIYRFPKELTPGATAKLERVGAPRDRGRPGPNDRITDGAISPDGEWAVLRTNAELVFYRTADLLQGVWRDARRVNVTGIGEPQGEGVTFGDAATIYVAGEGGGKKQPGTLARLTCAGT